MYFGSVMFFGLSLSGYVAITLHAYMLMAALHQWGYLTTNVYDDFFAWLYVNIDSNFVIGFMVWPTKELMGTFLELEEETKFTPMNEWQAYFFTILI